MELQSVLDKFEDNFTTIEVFKSSKNGYFTFNTFDIVPVMCDIKFFISGEQEVEESFCVDSVTLDTDDNVLSFELADRTKEMINIEDIITLDVSKISKEQYLRAIKDDEDFLKFLNDF